MVQAKAKGTKIDPRRVRARIDAVFRKDEREARLKKAKTAAATGSGLIAFSYGCSLSLPSIAYSGSSYSGIFGSSSCLSFCALSTMSLISSFFDLAFALSGFIMLIYECPPIVIVYSSFSLFDSFSSTSSSFSLLASLFSATSASLSPSSSSSTALASLVFLDFF